MQWKRVESLPALYMQNIMQFSKEHLSAGGLSDSGYKKMLVSLVLLRGKLPASSHLTIANVNHQLSWSEETG